MTTINTSGIKKPPQQKTSTGAGRCKWCAKGVLCARVQRIVQREKDEGVYEQKSEAWLEQRRFRVTGSEVAAALGENFFCRPETLLGRKVYNRRLENVAACDWGTRWEDEARKEYERRTGHRVVELGLLAHPDFPFLAASPDGVTYCGRLLEIKCPFSGKIPVVTVRPSVPKHYMGQVQVLMHVLGLQHADFVQFRPAGYGLKGVEDPAKTTCEYSIVEGVGRDEDWLSDEWRLVRLRQFVGTVQAVHSYLTRNPFVGGIVVNNAAAAAAAAGESTTTMQ